MKMIAAADAGWGIGKNNRLLVSIPADMKFFRETTSGGTVIMGRRTLESFPGGRPLKNRTNIVLSTDPYYIAPGALVVHSLSEMQEAIAQTDPDQVYCIGGASVYRLLLPLCDTALITRIDHVYDADTFMPDLDLDPEWEIAEQSEEQSFFDLTYRFVTYRRREEGTAQS